MYSTSTQKREYTFASATVIADLRRQANERFRMKYESVLEPGEEDVFLTPQEESTLRSIVTETGVRFAEDFKPAMWHSVLWTAFAYFKRFYLKHSIMEYSPKSVMMGCFYLAAKVDEFNLSIDEFVSNLRSGTPKSNAETILSMEPEIMLKLNYHLTVHCPFRPFEGHLLEMKTRSLLGFDLEQVRPHASDFFKKALFGDAMLLYPPSQIALAALKYALQKLGIYLRDTSLLTLSLKSKRTQSNANVMDSRLLLMLNMQKLLTFEKDDNLIKDHFLYKLLEVDTWKPNSTEITLCEKLIARLDEIITCVVSSAVPVTKKDSAALQKRMQRWITSCPDLDQRLQAKANPNALDVQNVNSDED
ncbi:unnamed protein product [Enterobius vermicularis]|uniref:CYCLIN domain-containing protein n=1 Tax=Enterobius vermicularis TaxID=51028 RepID=A0A0N4UWZ5_ENTVE|nr:unnamed protein product [Enterobius vermicularis]